MSLSFNVDEIFEMAVEIEKNAEKFYKKASTKTSDKITKKMFLALAEMEHGHLETFEKMRTKLSEEEKELMTFDPDNEAALYLQTMATLHGTEGKVSSSVELTGNETLKQILEIALNAEKDSVVFYFGLSSFVSEKSGREKIKEIIDEEISHITTLYKKLKNLN